VPDQDRLLAWIERRDGDEIEAAFVAAYEVSACACYPKLLISGRSSALG